jgi:hypothetical protein
VQMTFVALKARSATDGDRYGTLSRHLAKHSLALIDAGGEFEREPNQRKYATTRLDRHPNTLAHQKFADAILQGIPWGELMDSRLAAPLAPK